MGGYLPPAYEAGIELEELISAEIRAFLPGEIPPLFHYTSYSAIISIIKNGVLRAGSLNRVNDPVEIKYAQSVFRARLEDRLAYASGENLALLESMRSWINEPLKTTNVYSASFSHNGDDEKMWRRYAEKGRGVSFSLSSPCIQKWKKWPTFGYIYKCQYDDVLLINICDVLLSQAERLLKTTLADRNKEQEKTFNPNLESFSVSDFAFQFLSAVGHLSAAFKPQVWREEDEWRYVVVKDPWETSSNYIDLNISSQNEPFGIATIYAGPLCDRDRIDYIRDLLSEKETANCQIDRSIIEL